MIIKQKRVGLLLFTIFIHLLLWTYAWYLGHDQPYSKFYTRNNIKDVLYDEEKSYRSSLQYLQNLAHSSAATTTNKNANERSIPYLNKTATINKDNKINNHNSSETFNNKTSVYEIKRNCWLSISIISKNRATNNYLIRTVGYLLSRLEPYMEFPICIAWMNNERPPSGHKGLEIMKPLQEKRYIDIVQTSDYAKTLANEIIKYERNRREFKFLPPDDHRYGWHRNEIYDYAMALTYAWREFQSEYAVFLQDDALISKSFFVDLLQAIENLKLKNSWYALKLIYTDTFSGWGNDHILQIIFICTLFAFPITLVTKRIAFPFTNSSINRGGGMQGEEENDDLRYISIDDIDLDDPELPTLNSRSNLNRKNWKNNKYQGSIFNKMKNWIYSWFSMIYTLFCKCHLRAWKLVLTPVNLISAIIFMYYFCYVLALLYMASRQAIFPPYNDPGLIPLSNRMAVLVGQMYAKQFLPQLAAGLLYHISDDPESAISSNEKVICDWLVDRIARDDNWQQYLLVPNIVQHVGRQSSDFNRNQGDAIVTWSRSNTFPRGDEEF